MNKIGGGGGSTVKKYRILSLVTDTIYIFTLSWQFRNWYICQMVLQEGCLSEMFARDAYPKAHPAVIPRCDVQFTTFYVLGQYFLLHAWPNDRNHFSGFQAFGELEGTLQIKEATTL